MLSFYDIIILERRVMDRVKIKEEAKAMIKGNLWVLWKALLIVGIISGIASGIVSTFVEKKTAMESLVNFILSLAMMPLSAGLIYYILKFVRRQNPEVNDVWSQFSRFVPIIITGFLASIAVMIGIILLIIPGIILAFGLSFFQYILVDPEYKDLDSVAVLKESWRLTKGYKMDFFVFGLSFIGWGLLIVITLGLAAIYVVPYSTTATALYYENLKKAPRK